MREIPGKSGRVGNSESPEFSPALGLIIFWEKSGIRPTVGCSGKAEG